MACRALHGAPGAVPGRPDALLPNRCIRAACARGLLSAHRCACAWQAAPEDDDFLVPDDDAGDADGPKATAGLTLGTAAARILKEPLILGRSRAGLTPPTSAPGLGSPRPQLSRDWAHPRPQLSRDRRTHSCASTHAHAPSRLRARAHTHAAAHAHTHAHAPSRAGRVERSQVRAGFRIGRRLTRPSRCAGAWTSTRRAS